jgi:hypothetical protein
MGGTLAPEPIPRLRAGGRLPRGARLRLLRGGQPLAEAESALDLPAPGPGVYRVEVHVPGHDVPWVLSNALYVFAPADAEARLRRADWPPPPRAPTATAMIDSFEGRTTFAPGSVPESALRRDILDPAGGEDGRGAARLRFRVEPPSPAQPDPFAALVDWTHRDLSGRTGLVFSIRADGFYRVWVQVRDDNPASTDGGTEWWFTSVRTGTEWARATVPFASLRSINRHTDGRLDLDKVRALVFVVDRGSVKVGTEGTIWLDEVGLY